MREITDEEVFQKLYDLLINDEDLPIELVRQLCGIV